MYGRHECFKLLQSAATAQRAPMAVLVTMALSEESKSESLLKGEAAWMSAAAEAGATAHVIKTADMQVKRIIRSIENKVTMVC